MVLVVYYSMRNNKGFFMKKFVAPLLFLGLFCHVALSMEQPVEVKQIEGLSRYCVHESTLTEHQETAPFYEEALAFCRDMQVRGLLESKRIRSDIKETDQEYRQILDSIKTAEQFFRMALGQFVEGYGEKAGVACLPAKLMVISISFRYSLSNGVLMALGNSCFVVVFPSGFVMKMQVTNFLPRENSFEPYRQQLLTRIYIRRRWEQVQEAYGPLDRCHIDSPDYMYIDPARCNEVPDDYNCVLVSKAVNFEDENIIPFGRGTYVLVCELLKVIDGSDDDATEFFRQLFLMIYELGVWTLSGNNACLEQIDRKWHFTWCDTEAPQQGGCPLRYVEDGRKRIHGPEAEPNIDHVHGNGGTGVWEMIPVIWKYNDKHPMRRVVSRAIVDFMETGKWDMSDFVRRMTHLDEEHPGKVVGRLREVKARCEVI